MSALFLSSYFHPYRSNFQSLYQPSSHFNFTSFNGRPSFECLAYTNKSRPSRKLMSDEELCKNLREFVAFIGLPEGHVPSVKELAQNGRKDLANIVRRRGHKLVKELLANSTETAQDGFTSQEKRQEEFNRNNVHEEKGQEEKMNDMIEESAGFLLLKDNCADKTNGVESKSTVSSDDKILPSMEFPLSLQEKVDKFMKYGQLDTVEDDERCDYKLIDVEGQTSDNKEYLVGHDAIIYGERDFGHTSRVSNNSFGLNGTLMLPKPIHPSKTDTRSSSQRQPNTDIDEDMSSEARKMTNEVEVNRLKQLLHQKELELSRLKEEIEKEKQALTNLQQKAEDEISKAQKLISEKDAELHAAEESLSGLAEAKIQYSGEGQMVEVAGSFNGWHQKIKLEPQPSSVIVDPIKSRKSRFWSTTLWLYPGVYEIKFIVDGQWKIDPQKETAIRSGIENNILGVGR